MGYLIGLLTFLLVGFFMYKLWKQYNGATKPAPTPPPAPKYSPSELVRLMEVKRQAEELGDTATVEAVLNLTYEDKLPIERPDGSYTRYTSTLQMYDIAGINFRQGIAKYVGDIDGYIQPEPTNMYDRNAIAIYYRDGHHLGYIPARHTKEVRQLTRSHFPFPCWGVIEQSRDDDKPYYYGSIILEIPKQNEAEPLAQPQNNIIK